MTHRLHPRRFIHAFNVIVSNRPPHQPSTKIFRLQLFPFLARIRHIKRFVRRNNFNDSEPTLLVRAASRWQRTNDSLDAQLVCLLYAPADEHAPYATVAVIPMHDEGPEIFPTAAVSRACRTATLNELRTYPYAA